MSPQSVSQYTLLDSFTLNPGFYIVFGRCGSDNSLVSDMYEVLDLSINSTDKYQSFLNGKTRSSMTNGGGTIAILIIKVLKAITVEYKH